MLILTKGNAAKNKYGEPSPARDFWAEIFNINTSELGLLRLARQRFATDEAAFALLLTKRGLDNERSHLINFVGMPSAAMRVGPCDNIRERIEQKFPAFIVRSLDLNPRLQTGRGFSRSIVHRLTP